MTEDDFRHIASFFQPPEEVEMFNVKLYAMESP
ncbi:hypothetical protein Cyagr_2643 [Cyanobium gracile PCC 6307]|uniref:Uncharacterized protein n=1 Tax=Cyanobium gracile (strain ATCC 27147 / PCC 6307) TaxID=292564 RepID=K9PAG6_CYAGP|nr:hypothetical protein Cyagr_2643 [Cyanobium gracile PCC 6307]